MRRDRKDISFTDINLDIDMEIEKEMDKKTIKKPSGENTLDYYNDEMSRMEVERLFSGHSDKEVLEEVPVSKKERKKARRTEPSEEKVDYNYMVNLLNETQKEESVRREKEPEERTAGKKTQYIRAYKTMRLALIASVIVFLAIFSFLITQLQKANNDVKDLTARAAEIIDVSKDYEALSMAVSGYTRKIADYEATIEDLTGQLNNLTGGSTVQSQQNPSGGQTSTGSQTSSGSESEFPQSYEVKNGDSYWRISQKFYGDGKYYTEIMRANNAKSETDIHPGSKIVIPKI